MPLPKRPYVASADQVRIIRDGDDAIIEYADDSVATTHLKVGAEKLGSMTDDELLAFWNDGIEAREVQRQSVSYTATEIPAGKPQVEFFDRGNQWTPRGHVVPARSSPTPPFRRTWTSRSSPSTDATSRWASS